MLSKPIQSRDAGKVLKQEAQVQDSTLEEVIPLCSQEGLGDTAAFELWEDSSSMTRELHPLSWPAQVLRHLEGRLEQLLLSGYQSMGSLPSMLLPINPAKQDQYAYMTTLWHAPAANSR
jgi:hypothetical protein